MHVDHVKGLLQLQRLDETCPRSGPATAQPLASRQAAAAAWRLDWITPAGPAADMAAAGKRLKAVSDEVETLESRWLELTDAIEAATAG